MLAIQMMQQMIWQIAALLYSPVFWLAILLVYLQARQRARMKQDFFQLRREPVGKTVLLTTIAGLAGGVLASGLLLLLGVSVDRIGLEYLWMIALLLMLFRQRFLCFGYSGGVLAMLHYMIGWPDMDSSQLLAMVAVLHFTEAFLVLTTGHLNALPIYLQNDRRNVVGGFVLQMIWPLPLVMLSALYSGATVPQAGFLLLPDWWPVLRHPQSACAAAGVFILLPVLAALGYSDLAVSGSIKQKTRQSAVLLLLYSTVLLLLVLWTQSVPALQIIPAVFAPLGHEAVIWYGKRQELQSQCHFAGPDKGVMVLDVQQGSPAAKAGLRSEDWIFLLDGQPIANRQDFLRKQYLLSGTIVVKYLRKGKSRQCRMSMGRWSQPGIISAPDRQCSIYWTLGKDEGIMKFLYKKLGKRLKKI